LTRADGSSQPQSLTVSKNILVPRSFTPDGKRLAYLEVAGNPQIWTLPLEEQNGQLKAGQPEPFLKSAFADLFPHFSPDGRWLAYSSNESGRPEIYVRAFPQPASGVGGKWQVSNNGGDSPVWSRAGHELMYQSGDQIMTASYTVQGDTFVADKPVDRQTRRDAVGSGAGRKARRGGETGRRGDQPPAEPRGDDPPELL
jgi:Tol biopolymer transport system component